MAELNLLSRRYFLTYLSNQYVDEPIRTVFPGMKVDNPIYKDARKRVQSSYKTWKGHVLTQANQWIQRWISSARGERLAYLSSLTVFAEFRKELSKEFENAWLETVFKFGIEAVEFERITPDGLRFLRCEYLCCVEGFPS